MSTITPKKLTGNIVKDNPKEAAKRSPVAGQLNRTVFPTPQAKSDGIKRRNARLLIQEQLEQTLEEMLQDPMTDVLALTNFISSMPKDKTIVQAITAMILRDALNPKTEGKDKMKLLETLIKTSYGDKIEHKIDANINTNINIADEIRQILKDGKDKLEGQGISTKPQ